MPTKRKLPSAAVPRNASKSPSRRKSRLATAELERQRAEQGRYMAWASNDARIPLDREITNDEAMRGLDRLQAWVAYARQILAENGELSPQIRDDVRAMNARIDRVHDAGNSAHSDARNRIIAYALHSTWTLEHRRVLEENGHARQTEDEFVSDLFSMTMKFARSFAPRLAERLLADEDRARRAIQSVPQNRRSAIVVLTAILDDDSRIVRADRHARRDIERRFDKWQRLRKAQLRAIK